MNVRVPGWRGSWREVKTWHYMVESVSEKLPGMVIGESASQLQRLQHFGDAGTTGQPPRKTAAMEAGLSL